MLTPNAPAQRRATASAAPLLRLPCSVLFGVTVRVVVSTVTRYFLATFGGLNEKDAFLNSAAQTTFAIGYAENGSPAATELWSRPTRRMASCVRMSVPASSVYVVFAPAFLSTLRSRRVTPNFEINCRNAAYPRSH